LESKFFTEVSQSYWHIPELLRHAITGLDEQIAELQEIQTQLAAMIGRPPANFAVEAAIPQKCLKLSAEAREKISAAAKARLARDRKAKAKAQKAKPATEKAKLKGRPAKAQPALAKKKKSSAKKARSKPSTPAKDNEAEKVSKWSLQISGGILTIAWASDLPDGRRSAIGQASFEIWRSHDPSAGVFPRSCLERRYAFAAWLYCGGTLPESMRSG
jgi:hypothetical protein